MKDHVKSVTAAYKYPRAIESTSTLRSCRWLHGQDSTHIQTSRLRLEPHPPVRSWCVADLGVGWPARSRWRWHSPSHRHRLGDGVMLRMTGQDNPETRPSLAGGCRHICRHANQRDDRSL